MWKLIGEHAMNTLPKLAMLTALICALSGCDTPDARIKQNPDLFSSFPADIQANIKKGKIGVGYDKDMVTMSMGKPDRTYTRTTAEGTMEVWSYIASYTTTERQHIKGEFRVRDASGVYRTVTDMAWADVEQKHDYETLRIEFAGDEVKAIEEMNR